MALTVAEVVHPNAASTHVSFPPFKAKIVDVTFDSSYLTTGEIMTAASQGFTILLGAITLTHPTNTAGTLGMPCVVRASATGSQLAFQPLESAGDGDALDEAGSTNNLSTFTGRFMILGY